MSGASGLLLCTGNTLDLAIEGDGFFVVAKSGSIPRGAALATSRTYSTRYGRFRLSPEGVLITSSGNSVLGIDGPIVIFGDQITVHRDGSVFVDGLYAGSILIIRLSQNRAESICGELASAGRTIGAIRQGYLEQSPEAICSEISELIDQSYDNSVCQVGHADLTYTGEVKIPSTELNAIGIENSPEFDFASSRRRF